MVLLRSEDIQDLPRPGAEISVKLIGASGVLPEHPRELDGMALETETHP